MTTANTIECYAHLPDQSNFDDSWARQILNIWITAKKAYVAGTLKAEEFRDHLIDAIIEAADWRGQYEQACIEADEEIDDDAYDAYEAENRNEAFRLVPFGLYTEFRWIPESGDAGLDELIDTHGLKSTKWRSCYLEDIIPGDWLARFLRLVNVSSDALVQAGMTERPSEGPVFAQRVQESGFVVTHDPNLPALMTALEVIEALENAYYQAMPVVHAEIEVRALLELDPAKPMVLTTKKRGEVHVGFHCFVNGAGYMDTYPGSITVPANETGFTGVDRWSYGIDNVYGLVKSFLYVTPTTVN
jgi:hypothetical protein